MLAVLAWLASIVAASSAAAKPGAPAGHGSRNAPPGNNGTIKIDDAVFNGNRNTPHVGCEFWVNFFGYDGGSQQATLTFEPWAPTRGGSVAERQTSWSIPSRTAGNQLDHRYGPVDLTSALAGVTPHPQQGYHVRLTVHVTGSQGADVKHKVFWIQPCAPPNVRTPPPPKPPGKPRPPQPPPPVKPPSPTPPGAPPGLQPSPPAVAPGVTPPTPAPAVSPAPAPTPSPAVAALGTSPRVLGEQIRPAQPALARTGTDITSFAVLGVLCLAIGAAVRRRARRPAGG